MPDSIDALGMVFVFGSNLAGRHGKGAAAWAKRYYRAVAGCAEGIQGQCYAIPTKDARLATLPLGTVGEGVARFLEYAANHPQNVFQVTRIGCGLAGYDDDTILPLFAERTPNVRLPGVWLAREDPSLHRVIVAGGRDYGEVDGEKSRMDHDLDRVRERLGMSDVEFVSGDARGADKLGAAYAISHWFKLTRFPAPWARLGNSAGYFRNHAMAWYATHLVAYWDGQSQGTKHMIDLARRESLPVWVRTYAPHGRPQ